MIGEDSVFSGYGYDVWRYAHGDEIEQRFQVGSYVDTVIDGKPLHEFVADTTPRQVFIGIGFSF